MPRSMLLAALALLCAPVLAVDVSDTRLLAEPAVSAERIVFVYDDDLWAAGPGGGTAVRLTRTPGRERAPALSPDGRWLAFTAPYEDNLDVYVMPASGGAATRLTWHPGDDTVLGFTPDGRILFSTPRSVHTNRFRHLYTIAVDGGVPERLPVPTGFLAAMSPDGKRLAYVPAAEPFEQWKNYRGGRQSRIWILDLDDLSVVELPKPEGGSNDTDPMWRGDTLVFNSDRDGEFNLFAFAPADGSVRALTDLDDFPVRDPDIAPDGSVVFEHGGWLHRLPAADGTPQRLRIGAASDLPEAQPRLASGKEWVRAAAPSPDLARVALEYRGEIVTVPAEHGAARNLSRSPGAHDRSPAWSPDGSQVAWFSDAGGEYALQLAPQSGLGEPRRIALEGAGYYDQPTWSPDGTHLAYRDNSQALWVVEIDSGEQTRVAAEPVYSPLFGMTAAWSPDSRWLAYTVQEHGLIRSAWLWSRDSGEALRVSDGLTEVAEPVFDPNGKHLYYLASVDAGPLKDWFAQSSTDAQLRHRVVAVTLAADGPSPLPPRSDEVKAANGDDEDDKDKDKDKGDKDNGKEKDDSPPRVRVDAEGLVARSVALELPEANRRGLAVGASGELFWIESVGRSGFGNWDGPGELRRYQLDKREAKTLASDVEAFSLSAEGKKILYRKGGDWYATEVGDELKAGKGKLPVDRVSVRVEPRAEWAQILDEAWRINRDYFYADNFHGADWNAIRYKYRAFLPHLANRGDLDRVIRMMLSELAVGHSYLGPGEDPDAPEAVRVGLLGADLEAAEGRWKFARIYRSVGGSPELHAPLATAGVSVADGEFLLEVEGREISADDNPYAAFVDTVDRPVRIRVGPRADGRGARDLTVVPVGSEVQLRYFDWVEGNLRYVDERSGGRVAYVHVPNTAGAGHAMFKRYFYPQSHKPALILDERYNGGGLVADYYIDILRRPYVASWGMRHGADLVSPRGAIFGPKVMLIDENAGSGGDLLPYMFRRLGLGPLVGTRTWGGLVGILGFPVLMDGGAITAPNLGFYNEDGWIIENEGVAPDVEVPLLPAEVADGRDPQLERALQIVLRELEANPVQLPPKPDLPVRAGGR